MDKIIDVAGYLAMRYREISGEKPDEMKLHKLLYFIQRESFAITGEQAFEGDFEGWKYGPVCVEVRSAYYDGEIIVQTKEISEQVQYIVNNIVLEYGSLASWKLSELSHKEISWQNARKNLRPGENGGQILSIDDIREDAKKVRPYDHVWDMYYDEFDSEEVSE